MFSQDGEHGDGHAKTAFRSDRIIQSTVGNVNSGKHDRIGNKRDFCRWNTEDWMKIQYALGAIQTIRSNAWSSFPSCLSVNSISDQCQPRGPIMQHVFPICDTTWHAEDSGGEITGFKISRTHTHTFLIPLCLMRNASSPEPQTQFSTLLWALAVSPPARNGNRQHLSPGRGMT